MSNVVTINNRDAEAVAIGSLYRASGRNFVDAVNQRLECGRLLNKKKEESGYGVWGPWLRDNEAVLGFTETVAQKMMLGAKRAPVRVSTEDEALEISRMMWRHESKQITKQVTKRIPANTYVSPEIDDEDDDEERVPGELPNSTQIRGLIQRAKEAIEMAETDDLQGVAVSEEVIRIVYEAAKAWTNLGKNLTTSEDE